MNIVATVMIIEQMIKPTTVHQKIVIETKLVHQIAGFVL